MTQVLVGNPNPQMQLRVPRTTDEGDIIVDTITAPARHLNQSVTRVDMREGFDDPDEVALALSTSNDRLLRYIARSLPDDKKHYAIGVAEMDQIMGIHAGGTAPTWVSSDDPDFAAVLGEHFECMVGEPTALITNQGRDVLHAQHLSTAAQPASCNYMGLTANAAAESAANTSLPAEITTAGGGLIRKQATYAHTAGTNTSTLTATFTANGTDTLPVTVAKTGVFNHITTAATLDYEKLLNATTTLTASGDNVTVTFTLTAG